MRSLSNPMRFKICGEYPDVTFSSEGISRSSPSSQNLDCGVRTSQRDGDGSLELNKLIAPRDLLCIARDVRSCALNQLIFCEALQQPEDPSLQCLQLRGIDACLQTRSSVQCFYLLQDSPSACYCRSFSSRLASPSEHEADWAAKPRTPLQPAR